MRFSCVKSPFANIWRIMDGKREVAWVFTQHDADQVLKAITICDQDGWLDSPEESRLREVAPQVKPVAENAAG